MARSGAFDVAAAAEALGNAATNTKSMAAARRALMVTDLYAAGMSCPGSAPAEDLVARLDPVETGRWASIREKIAVRWWIVRLVLLAPLAVLLFVVRSRFALWMYLLVVAILTAVFQ